MIKSSIDFEVATAEQTCNRLADDTLAAVEKLHAKVFVVQPTVLLAVHFFHFLWLSLGVSLGTSWRCFGTLAGPVRNAPRAFGGSPYIPKRHANSRDAL